MTTPPCEECGFDFDAVDLAEVPVIIRSFAKRYRAPLTRFLRGEDGNALVRRRPAPEVWSALEYAAHVRDVFGRYDDWIRLCLAENTPALEGSTPDELAVESKYNDDDPATVAEALAANAERLAATVESVPPDGWDRAGVRFGEERSVRLSARRAVHEGSHHLLDIGRGLRAVRDQAKASG